MIADVGAWVALLAAVLSIGVELWKVRSGDGHGRGNVMRAHDMSLANRLRFTRGVTAMSVVPALVLVLSALVLQAVRTSLLLRARLVRDCIGDQCYGSSADYYQAATLELWVPVIAVVVVFIWVTVGLMVARIILNYGIRVVEWVVGLVSAGRARRTLRQRDEKSPSIEPEPMPQTMSRKAVRERKMRAGQPGPESDA